MTSELDGVPAVSTRPRIYPMSCEQEALWLDDLVSDGPSRYLESWAGQLTGQLDIGGLEWAISQVIARHEVLRSRLTERAGEPVQIVTAPGPVQLEQLSCSPAALPAELGRIVAEPLDLNKAPIRPWLVSWSPDKFVLVVQFHHAVIDDWALDIFQRELMHFYSAWLCGRRSSLEPLPMPMQAGDYAVAQRAAGIDLADLAYWQKRVKCAPRSCTIPPDHPGPEELPHRAERHLFEISPELGQAVRKVSRTLRATPYTVFAGAMAALLWRYGEPEEVIFGTPVSLRGSADVDDMIGCLSNPLPLRLAVRDSTFRTLTDAAKAEVLGALEHRAVPYPELVRMTRLGVDDADMPPLCDAALVVDDMRWEPFSLPGLTAERIYLPPGRAKFAVTFTLVAGDDGGYTGFCDFDSDVYDAATMALVASQFTSLLARCIAAPDEPVGQVLGSAAGPASD
jgi:hypothetical protein